MTCILKLVLGSALLVAAAAAAAATKSTSGKTNDTDDRHDERKTLSQQVAEGKYGLIQSELFARRPARPGVLSYERNSEVPRDDENTLGGLAADEIWLAEDHLLVLRGGAFHRTANEMPWPAIDEYEAPGRQVKIPARPKVPPPFPVQLEEGGPLQYLGAPIAPGEADGTRTSAGNGAATPHPVTNQHSADVAPGRAPFQVPPLAPENFPGGDGPGPFPFPPVRAPPLNQSIDYDDPSIYYPPPYSFYYHADNITEVPPGPLVPGIVLPPPPDFFAPLRDNANTTSPPRTPPPTVVLIPHRRPPPSKPPIRYLPYDDNSIHLTTTPAPPRTTTLLYENDLQEQETPTVLIPTTPPPKTHTAPSTPDVSAPYPVHRQYITTQAPPTPAPVLTAPYKPRTQPKLVSIISIAPPPKKASAVAAAVAGTAIGAGGRYVTPAASPVPTRAPHISVTIESARQVYEERPRSYLQPTRRPHVTVQPVTVHYVAYDAPRTRLKPTNRPRVPSGLVRVPLTRTQVSSSAVPLKSYFSSADVETNSVQPQPQVDYYFYEEDVTEAPRTNFDRHVQQLRQQIQSYLKPTAKPVYEYSFQAANYHPTSPAPYLTTQAPPQYDEYVTENIAQKYVQDNIPQKYVQDGIPHKYVQDNIAQKYVSDNIAQKYAPETVTQKYVSDNIEQKYVTTFGQRLTTIAPPTKSLAHDTLVNYREPRPGLEPAAELVDSSRAGYKKSPGTYISYQLPGEGAHFYFLTPQLVKQQRNVGLEQQQFAQRQYEQQRLEQQRLEQRLQQQEGRYRRPQVSYYYPKQNERQRRNNR